MNNNKYINMNKQILIFISITLIIASGMFFGGIQFQKNKSSSMFSNIKNGQFSRPDLQQNNNKKMNGIGFGNMTNGQILSIEENSIILKTQIGGSKIVNITDETKINKSINASIADLVKDLNVIVSGKINADNTITAESIEIKNK